jgi:hypothetical protein
MSSINCLIDAPWGLNTCSDNTAGLEWVAFQTYNAQTQFGLTASGSLVSSISPTASFYVFEHDQEAAGLAQTPTVNDNGSAFVEQILTIRFNEYSQESQQQMAALLKTRVRAIAKTNNGDYLILGISSPGRVNGGSAGPNRTFTDIAGGELTIRFRGKTFAPFVDSAILTPLLVFES